MKIEDYSCILEICHPKVSGRASFCNKLLTSRPATRVNHADVALKKNHFAHVWNVSLGHSDAENRPSSRRRVEEIEQGGNLNNSRRRQQTLHSKNEDYLLEELCYSLYSDDKMISHDWIHSLSNKTFVLNYSARLLRLWIYESLSPFWTYISRGSVWRNGSWGPPQLFLMSTRMLSQSLG